MDVSGEEIYNWIDDYNLSRQKKNINRDFSDAVPLAEVLKHHYPKLVQLHNYTPRNSVGQKLINWTTLQRKVLRKLHIQLSAAEMEDLARAVPGAIELLLYKVKSCIDAKKLLEEQQRNSQEDYLVVEGLSAGQSGPGGTVLPVRMRLDGKISDQRIVPAELYDKLSKDILEKEETIAVLKNKIKHLENLLAIKEERIADLIEQHKKLSEADDSNSLSNKLSYRLFGSSEIK